MLTSDQEYCLECGGRRAEPRRSPWIAPVVVAVAVIALAAAIFAISYEGLKSDSRHAIESPGGKQPGGSAGSGPAGGRSR